MNPYFEQMLDKLDVLDQIILAMDSTTLGEFYAYINARVNHVDASSSRAMAYCYAESLLDELVEFAVKEEDEKKR